MQTKTKSGAETILLVAQNLLKGGRPRKPVGRPRPKQVGGKLSLLAAMKQAQKMVGATRAQYEAALYEIDTLVCGEVMHYGLDYSASAREIIAKYDEIELDTRHIVRTLGKAIKALQQQ
jgi:hypothetical protein